MIQLKHFSDFRVFLQRTVGVLEIFTAAALGIVTAVLALTLKSRPDISVLISIAGGVVILAGFLPKIAEIIVGIGNIARIGGIDGKYLKIILKSAGIAIAVTVCASVCRDAGQSALALKLEIAGRIAIILMAIPVIENLLDVISLAMR